MNFLGFLIIAIFSMIKTASSSCRGLDFNLQPCVSSAGQTYRMVEGTCYYGTVEVHGPHGGGSWQSTRVQCTTPNGCGWFCYSDPGCAGEAKECAPGYASLSCNCVNINFTWNVRLAGNKIYSWQGNNGVPDGDGNFLRNALGNTSVPMIPVAKTSEPILSNQ